MYRIDNATAVAVKPTPGVPGPQPDGFYAQGATVVDADHLNAMQDEIAGVVEAAGLTLDKADDTQLWAAIQSTLGSKLDVTNLFQADWRPAIGTPDSVSVIGWNVRNLGSIYNSIAGASILNDQITLPTGVYWVEADAGASGKSTGTAHTIRFQNITDASTAAYGSAETAGGPDAEENFTRSMGSGLFTIPSSKVYQLEHYTSAAVSLGQPTGAQPEVYARLRIWKVAL